MLEVSSRKQVGVWFAIALDEKGKMIACSFSGETRAKTEGEVLRSTSHDAVKRKVGPLSNTRIRELYKLYMGRGKPNPNSFDLYRISPFKRSVYRVLCQVPRGRVTTYGAIAKKLGGKRYARAVGTAVGSNPMPLVIPCHRVVPSTLNVGNYGLPGRKPSEGTPVKRQLLEREGVRFNGLKVSKRSLWSPK